MTQPLFIIGNKRSGTSQLVRLLNLHPHIYVSHESDIGWILYQYHNGRGFTAHAWDSDRGMRTTLELADNLLQADKSPKDNFLAVQTCLMKKGTPWQSPQEKTDLKWIGDKKPFQHTDSELLAFLLKHFPDAHFLHIVRHPFHVVASSDRFNQTTSGDFWLGLSPAQKLERWTFHEQQVIKLREMLPKRLHTLRYEDLCRRTRRELSGVFSFLKVNNDAKILREAACQTILTATPVPPIPCSDETLRVAAIYGYDLRHPPGRIKITMQTWYWGLAKRLGA
ncbi:MAG TPA: sulfotransferase [Phycisphaerae bacterium]|nr:sulfotransferase [Phycisphaerae bacterium]